MIKSTWLCKGIPLLALAILASACSSDSTAPDEEESLFLQITNGQTEPMTVRVVGASSIPEGDRITADFGTVADGATTTFKAVNASFMVYVNDEVLENGSNSNFGIDDTPTNQWTLTIMERGGWSLEAYF
jgi:hypothetical protein